MIYLDVDQEPDLLLSSAFQRTTALGGVVALGRPPLTATKRASPVIRGVAFEPYTYQMILHESN